MSIQTTSRETQSAARSGTSGLVSGGAPLLEPQQFILLALLLLEILVFSLISKNFQTWSNFYEVLRLSVELGLLALAMTPVIVTGGIDLSVGSLLGLSAIVMGMLWKDAHLPLAIAALAALVLGLLGGGLNALLITRLRVPPLIVTLGTMYLFRGAAEGIASTKNYTDFPAWFKFLGQGYIGAVPTQVPLFVAAAIAFWLMLHRSTIGRALCAIGYAPDGARYAGIPVGRRLGLIYMLSALAAATGGILYSAHWGQAKADAGTGYELEAIAAVVLGGTSIFGGRGNVLGTLIGLFAIAVLKRGLFMTQSLPAELADILSGLLLLIAIGLNRKPASARPGTSVITSPGNEELEMKNSQVAVLSLVMLLAAAIIAGSNFWLIRSISPVPSAAAPRRIKIAMMPKSKGNAYFIACRKGADEAAKELGVDLIWDGPTSPDPTKQNEVVEAWITSGVDVISVACENGDGIADVLAKARAKGIKVITWDADTKVDSRDFFVNQATPDDIGQTLMDNTAKIMHGKGEFAIISASTTASNMIAWRKSIERRRAEKYPDMTMDAHEACDDKQEIAFDQTRAIMNRYPNVKVIMAICSPAAPGAAEAVTQSGRTDVKVVGVSLPNDNKRYVKSGVTDDIVLWKTQDLGYLAVLAAFDLQTGKLHPGDTSMDGERLGKIEIQKDGNIILGKPFTFTKDNIDQFDF